MFGNKSKKTGLLWLPQASNSPFHCLQKLGCRGCSAKLSDGDVSHPGNDLIAQEISGDTGTDVCGLCQ